VSMTEGWFAVYTLSCREKQVSRHMEIHAIEHFLPVTKSRRRWKNGCTVVIDEPLFPGYLFVRIDRTERTHVLAVPGVHSIVGTGKDPIPLPQFEIETLRRSIDFLKIEPHPYLNVGEKATILRGPLAGMTGIVTRKKNGLRFVLPGPDHEERRRGSRRGRPGAVRRRQLERTRPNEFLCPLCSLLKPTP
jgi:transcription antitermination factor NusG